MAKRKPKATPRPSATVLPFSIPRPAEFSVPEHALPIFIGADGGIYLALASPNDAKRGHNVKLNSSDPEAFLKVLTKVLRDHKNAPRATIAQPGLPVQAMLDAITRSAVKPFRPVLSAKHLDDIDFEMDEDLF